jgi:hypothetical protein
MDTHLPGHFVDPGYKKTVNISKEEADKRSKIVTEIEYDFQLAILKGTHYFGKAVINFYVEKEPTDGELFIELQTLCISNLLVNDEPLKAEDYFKDQRLQLKKEILTMGWNTLTLCYLNAYNTNSTGLHTFTD